MKFRTSLFCGIVVALLALSAIAGLGCGEEQQAETVTKKETKTVSKKGKTTKKTGTAPKTAPATPTPAPTPPAPVTPTPAPGGGVPTNQAADQAAMLELIQYDSYYSYGDTYEVMAYDPYNSSGTVLIATYYTDYTQFTEVYMLKDQYGWYANGDYTYTIP